MYWCFVCLTELLVVVYVLDEIAELANGGGELAQGLADATVKRLGNKSPVVKQKVKAVIAVCGDASLALRLI